MRLPPMTGPERPTIVLLHGLARTHRSLAGLRRALENAGFPTWARTYPSRRLSIAHAAAWVADWIAHDIPNDRPMAAVTHSLGGILVRHISAHIDFTRIIMLAPPNQGSRVAHALGDRLLFRWLLGPAGQELAARDASRSWPQPRAPCVVIAGTRARSAFSPLYWLTQSRFCFAPGEPNDGTLAVTETRLPNMAGFFTVDTGHASIVNNENVRDLVVRLLENGAHLAENRGAPL